MSEKELQLQRLVDRQLDRQQIQALMSDAQQDPELWQDIAVAFVEDQLFNQEINAIDWNEPVPSKPQTPRPTQSHLVHAKMILALAAMLVAGLWLGRSLQNQTPNDDSRSVVKNEDNGVDQNLLTTTPTTFGQDDLDSVPLYTLGEAREKGLLTSNPVPQQMVDHLNRNGIQLEQDTQFVSGRTKDGRRVLFPVQSIKFNPGN